MVSFQCHNCGDVVKKPKLDQHRFRCHGGFDCIDCSTAFHSPAEYRLHTSCISEAEKYQKSLYKGPKSGMGKRNDSEKNQQYGSYNRNYRNSFHQYGARGCGRPPWGAPRSQVTGANDTPLGTPVRMSPVSRPVEVEEEKAEEAGHTAAQMETLAKQKKDKKEKDKGSKKEKDEKDKEKGARKDKDEKDKEKGAREDKDKKHRKRKAEDEGTRTDAQSSKKKTKVEKQIVDPLSPVKKDVKEENEKDRKKKGKEKKQKASEMKEEEMGSMGEGREAREKQKKQKIGETMVIETPITVNVDVDVDMASPEDTSNNDGKSQNSKNKKKKKNKQKISAERDEDQDGEVTGSVEA